MKVINLSFQKNVRIGIASSIIMHVISKIWLDNSRARRAKPHNYT